MHEPVHDEADCFVGDRSFLGADLAIQNCSRTGLLEVM
jgi:hypothetical protein